MDSAAASGRDTVVEHGGERFDVVADGIDLWVVRGPDGRVVGTVGVESRAGEEGGTVFIGRPADESRAWVEGTDFHGIALAVVNEAVGVERERHDVNPPAVHVRGGIISRTRSEVDGLS